MFYSEVLANLETPDDFDNKIHIYALYVKSDKNKAEYEYLVFHKDKLVRDYLFESEKTFNINNLELTIYQYQDSYILHDRMILQRFLYGYCSIQYNRKN